MSEQIEISAVSPQVSIITPCFNQAAFLPTALASVAEQSGVNVEHIIIDPGSNDGSRDILRSHAAQRAGVQLIFQPDDGAAQAVNAGMERSSGEVIGWLPADDFYASRDVLRVVFDAFAEHPDWDVVYGRGALVGRSGDARPAAYANKSDKIAELLSAGQEPFLQSAVFFRRALLDTIGFANPHFRLAYDVEFWARAMAAGARFAPINLDIGRKRDHPLSTSRLYGGMRSLECAFAVRKHLTAPGAQWLAKAAREDVVRSVGRPSASVDELLRRVVDIVERRLDAGAGKDDLLVVLGNGPSLADFDFEQLRNVDAIGMNAAYRHWRTIGWRPRYYACLDVVVGISHRDAIEDMVQRADELGMEAFLLRRNLIEAFGDVAGSSPRVIDFDTLVEAGGLLDCPPVTTGSHSALFGALLGYSRMALLGIDCSYVETIEQAMPRGGVELEVLETPSHNPNYYFAEYQMAGDRYNIPNPVPDLHQESWRAVALRLASRGIEVWNAGPRSQLDCFPRSSFAELKTGRSGVVQRDVAAIERRRLGSGRFIARWQEHMTRMLQTIMQRPWFFSGALTIAAFAFLLAAQAWQVSPGLALSAGGATLVVGVAVLIMVRIAMSWRSLRAEMALVRTENDELRVRLTQAERRLAKLAIAIETRPEQAQP